jgi:hypothetical protein
MHELQPLRHRPGLHTHRNRVADSTENLFKILYIVIYYRYPSDYLHIVRNYIQSRAELRAELQFRYPSIPDLETPCFRAYKKRKISKNKLDLEHRFKRLKNTNSTVKVLRHIGSIV